MVDNPSLVIIEGNDVTEEDLRSYIKILDFDRISKI